MDGYQAPQCQPGERRNPRWPVRELERGAITHPGRHRSGILRLLLLFGYFLAVLYQLAHVICPFIATTGVFFASQQTYKRLRLYSAPVE